MRDVPEIPPKHLPALRHARESLTVADEVGLALRAHRRRLGLSQRAYAAMRGLSRAMLARLEGGGGQMSLDTVTEALQGTGYRLFVGYAPDGPMPPAASTALASPPPTAREEEQRRVPPDAWEPTDLVARVRGEGRRFPAHRKVQAVVNPPLWWWMHEFFSGPTEEPQWYAPVTHLDLLTSGERARPEQTPPDAA